MSLPFNIVAMLGRLSAVFFFLALSRIAAQQDAGIVEGNAVDSLTAQPLAKTTIRLVPGENTAPEQIAITDAAGAFHFGNVPPSTYRLTAERSNYLKSNGPPLKLNPGDKLSGLTMELSRFSIITGLVLDENGDPLAKVLVYPVSRRFMQGDPYYFRPDGAITNDAGEYRLINVPPGRYYLCADINAESFVEKQGEQEKRLVWGFYPGSRTLDGALPVDVEAARDVSGIDLQLHPEPVFHIRGKLVGRALKNADTDLSFGAYPHGLGRELIELDNDTDDKADGSFDFSGAPAGTYDLVLLSGEHEQIIGKTSIDVKKSNVDGVTLTVPNRFEVQGVVHVLDTSSTSLTKLIASASDVDSPLMGSPYQAHVDADGNFKLENVWAGRYVFGVGALGGTAADYIKSIQYGGREVLGTPIELTNGSEKIEITLAGGAGQVEGSVQSTDQNISVGGVLVVLSSNPPHSHRDRWPATTDQNGHFSFANVTPGDYFAFAVTGVDDGLLQNRSLIDQLRENATPIKVAENAKLQIRLSVLPPEEVQRALRSLGL